MAQILGIEMNHDRITELAKQAGASKYVNRHCPDRTSWGFVDDRLQRFAELVRAEALEDAAKRCEQMDVSYSACEQFVSGEAALECAEAIRKMK